MDFSGATFDQLEKSIGLVAKHVYRLDPLLGALPHDESFVGEAIKIPGVLGLVHMSSCHTVVNFNRLRSETDSVALVRTVKMATYRLCSHVSRAMYGRIKADMILPIQPGRTLWRLRANDASIRETSLVLTGCKSPVLLSRNKNVGTFDPRCQRNVVWSIDPACVLVSTAGPMPFVHMACECDRTISLHISWYGNLLQYDMRGVMRVDFEE